MNLTQILAYVDSKIRGNKTNAITGDQMNFILKEIANLSGTSTQVQTDWNATSGLGQLLNKPSVFPPSSHTHAISDISSLSATLSNLQANVENRIFKFGHVFIPSDTITIATAGRPTEAEFQTWNSLNGSHRNKFLFYTGTTTEADKPRYIGYVDNNDIVEFVFIRRPNYVVVKNEEFALVTGTVPTTTAAARTFFSTNGVTFVQLLGAAGNTNGFSFNFQIPEDYIENATKSLIFNYMYTTGSSGNVLLTAVVKTTSLNSSTSDAGTTFSAVAILGSETNSPLKQLSIDISTLSFVPGQIVTVRCFRITNNAFDTSTSNIFILNAEFTYD